VKPVTNGITQLYPDVDDKEGYRYDGTEASELSSGLMRLMTNESVYVGVIPYNITALTFV
jgi:hypothetical protein